jgi:hypothetical protein
MTGEEPPWLQHLRALGQAQGFLTYAQVNDTLPRAMVDPEEIEAAVEQLKHSGIRVVLEPRPEDVEKFLSALTEQELVRFLVRYAYQLTIGGRGTYVPEGDDLENPKLMRLVNETVHRALDHADACLSERTPRRPHDALSAVLFGHDSDSMRKITRWAFEEASKRLRGT